MSGQGQGLTWQAARLVGQKEKREKYASVYVLDAFLDTLILDRQWYLRGVLSII